MRRAAASAVSAAASSRLPPRAAAVSPASVSATLASLSSPVSGLLPSPGRVSTVRGRVGIGGILFFGRRDEQLPGAFRVTDRRLGVEAEHRGQVERVRSLDEGLVELAVDSQAFQGGGLAAEGIGQL